MARQRQQLLVRERAPLLAGGQLQPPTRRDRRRHRIGEPLRHRHPVRLTGADPAGPGGAAHPRRQTDGACRALDQSVCDDSPTGERQRAQQSTAGQVGATRPLRAGGDVHQDERDRDDRRSHVDLQGGDAEDRCPATQPVRDTRDEAAADQHGEGQGIAVACTQGSAGPAPHPADDEGLPRHEKDESGSRSVRDGDGQGGGPRRADGVPERTGPGRGRATRAAPGWFAGRRAGRTSAFSECALSAPRGGEERNVVGNECAAPPIRLAGRVPRTPSDDTDRGAGAAEPAGGVDPPRATMIDPGRRCVKGPSQRCDASQAEWACDAPCPDLLRRRRRARDDLRRRRRHRRRRHRRARRPDRVGRRGSRCRRGQHR